MRSPEGGFAHLRSKIVHKIYNTDKFSEISFIFSTTMTFSKGHHTARCCAIRPKFYEVFIKRGHKTV